VDTLRKVRKWLIRGTIAGALVAGALLTALVSGGAIESSENADCIVVPGAAVKPGRVPSDALQYRLEGALKLFKERRAPRVIVTGGGEGDYAEAEVMTEWLVERGVPRLAILAETQSGTTRDSGVYVAALMRKHGLQSALVCTQWFHVARTRLCLEQEGIETLPAPCGGNTLIKEPFFVAREMVALPAYALRVDELR
jgi:uncharacterized SAM-binding protein YcdF (DUF218 family)